MTDAPQAPVAPLPNAPATTPDDRTMAMLAHLLGIFTGFVGALIIWLVKKDQSKFVDANGKEALNFQLTMAIAWVIAVVTSFFCIGFFIMLGIIVIDLIFCIKGAMAANSGQIYRYPVCLRLIK